MINIKTLLPHQGLGYSVVLVDSSTGGLQIRKADGTVYMTIEKDGSISTATTISNNLTVTGDLDVTGDYTLIGGLDVTGNVDISGNTTQVGDVNITGNTTQLGNVDISGDTTLTGDLDVTGNTTQIGNVDISGNTTQVGDVNITGNTTLTGDLDVTGNTTLTGDIDITGNTTQVGNVDISGDTTLIGDLDVTGNTTQVGNTSTVGDIDITGNLDINGDTTQIGDVVITGTVNILETGTVPPLILPPRAVDPSTSLSGGAVTLTDTYELKIYNSDTANWIPYARQDQLPVSAIVDINATPNNTTLFNNINSAITYVNDTLSGGKILIKNGVYAVPGIPLFLDGVSGIEVEGETESGVIIKSRADSISLRVSDTIDVKVKNLTLKKTQEGGAYVEFIRLNYDNINFELNNITITSSDPISGVSANKFVSIDDGAGTYETTGIVKQLKIKNMQADTGPSDYITCSFGNVKSHLTMWNCIVSDIEDNTIGGNCSIFELRGENIVATECGIIGLTNARTTLRGFHTYGNNIIIGCNVASVSGSGGGYGYFNEAGDSTITGNRFFRNSGITAYAKALGSPKGAGNSFSSTAPDA